MKRKVLRLFAVACFAFCASPAGAQSVSFTIDPSASELFVNIQGTAFGSSSLQGTLLALHDPFAASLTFAGGSTIQASSTVVQAPFPAFEFGNTFGSVEVVSGTINVDFSGASFDIVAGTAFDGASASALNWSGSGAAFVSGVAQLQVSGLIGNEPATATFSGNVSPASSFTPTAGAGFIGLQNGPSGAALSIPFDVAMTPSNMVVDVTGTADSIIESLILANLNSFFADEFSRIPGTLFATGAPLPVPSIEVHWAQAGSGSWDVAANWTPSVNPGTSNDVRIDPGVSVTVTGPAADTQVNSLEIGGGAGIATLSLHGGRIGVLTDTVKVLANGVLTGDGTLAAPGVLNQGTVLAQNLTLQGVLTNEGVVTGSGRLNADIANTTGRISVGPGQSLRIGGSVDSAATGTVEVFNGELHTVGTFLNAGRFAAHHAILRLDGGFFNHGQLLVSSGTVDAFGAVRNESDGQVIVSGMAVAAFYDDVLNIGEMRAGTDSGIVYFGDVSGSGAFTGPGTHFFEGSFNPGMSPGAASVSNAVFGLGSTLEIELAGSAYDRLVAGNLTLDGGTLLVTLLDGFTPGAGHSFDILDWTALTGEFGILDLPGLGHNLAWNTSMLYEDGTLSVAAIPEPETYALLLAGLALLGFAARRRRLKLGMCPIGTL